MKKAKRSLRPSSRPASPQPTSGQAALFGLITATIAVCLTLWLTVKNRTASDYGIRLVLGLLLLASVISATSYLFTTRPPRNHQSLNFARTTIGLAVLMGIFLGFDIRQSNRWELTGKNQSAVAMQQAVQDYQDSLRQDFERNGSLAYDQKRDEKLRADAGHARDQTDGLQNKLMLAGAAYFERMQKVSQAYAQAQQAWADAHVLDASRYTSRQDISEKRALVVKLQEQNLNMSRFIHNSVSYYEEELKQQGLPGEMRTEAKTGFRAKTQPRHKIMLEIRGYDEEIFTTVLTILDTLSAHFGEWSVNETGTVQIADPGVSKLLKDSYHQLETIGQQQSAAQARLIELGP